MFPKELFANRLKALLQDADISADQLASAAGISPDVLNRALSGQEAPSLDDFVAIAAYFQVPTAYLLNQPPFDAWEQALKRKTAVLEALARMLPFPAESLADLHLPAFLFVYNAAFRWAEYDSDRQTLTLYPSFSKGAPITLS